MKSELQLLMRQNVEIQCHDASLQHAKEQLMHRQVLLGAVCKLFSFIIQIKHSHASLNALITCYL